MKSDFIMVIGLGSILGLLIPYITLMWLVPTEPFYKLRYECSNPSGNSLLLDFAKTTFSESKIVIQPSSCTTSPLWQTSFAIVTFVLVGLDLVFLSGLYYASRKLHEKENELDSHTIRVLQAIGCVIFFLILISLNLCNEFSSNTATLDQLCPFPMPSTQWQIQSSEDLIYLRELIMRYRCVQPIVPVTLTNTSYITWEWKATWYTDAFIKNYFFPSRIFLILSLVVAICFISVSCCLTNGLRRPPVRSI